MSHRHVDAAEILIAQASDPSAVDCETLLGLARAWDRIETTGEGIGNVANLANQVSKTLDRFEFVRGDPFDALVGRIMDEAP